jgi:hypothetical protein
VPKRVLDGEGIWRSDKIGRVQPVRARAEYANILPLALANGSFECSGPRVWSIVYSYNRPDVQLADVEIFLNAFEEAGLLFRWTESDGKSWAYFVGIEKPGRLPGKSRKGKNEKIGADPPQKHLRKFLESKNFPGFGFGFGSGSCTGSGTGHTPRASHAPEPAPSAPGVCEQLVATWNSLRGTLPEVHELTQKRRQNILARVRKDPEFQSKFETAVRKAAQTPFLCGSGDRGWRAGFDWFIADDTNALGVLEGKYDGTLAPSKGGTNGKRSADDPNERTQQRLKAASAGA